MALAVKEQIKETIGRSNNILITFKKDYHADSLASALALKLLLEKMEKRAEIICDGFTLEKNHRFLPESTCVANTLEGAKQFKICLDLNKNSLKDFSYNVQGDRLEIYLTPKHGNFRHENLRSEDGHYRYDLIIIVDTEDLESLGSIFDQNTDFFYQTTIINFDHKPENESYGQINQLDPNMASTAELIFTLFEELSPELINQQVAQCLLCGIIAKTKSFKSPSVTPSTLHIASHLMKLGADRDEIIKNLYYTKSIDTLKLWGKVLTRLKSDSMTRLAWSYLDAADFAEAKLNPEKLSEVIEELIITAPEAKTIILFYEHEKNVGGLIYSDTNNSAKEMVKNYNPLGSARLARFTIKTESLSEAIRLVTTEIKNKIK